MTKLYSLFGGTTTDTNIKAVEVNQIVQMQGYSYDRYAIHKITHNDYGYQYHLINLRTLDMQQSRIIKPLSQKFGIGMYYDENNIEFMPEAEVAELYAKANEKRDSKRDAEKKEEERREAVRVIGRKWLQENLPDEAQALIVARLKQDESDSQSDYYASRTQRTVILGFSKHKRDIFSEMRKHASNFKETAYLAEYNEKYEHREKYSMGAGCPDSIHLGSKQTKNEQPISEQVNANNLSFEIVDYSEKAIALFGDTKEIKDLLKAMGGKFNPRLTHNAGKQAGWIFQKSKREELQNIINLGK